MNYGQTCVAPDYVLVHKANKDALLKELQSCITRFYGPDFQVSSPIRVPTLLPHDIAQPLGRNPLPSGAW